MNESDHQPASVGGAVPIIISLTDAGRILAVRLQQQLSGSEHWHKPTPFTQQIRQAFVAQMPLIFVCAAGIVMRTLAPVLVSKRDDPPVLVMDEQGKFVIALLSGHEGGANAWAANVAALTGGEAVITSSRDYLNPVYAVGMGCERNCTAVHLQSLLADCLVQANLTLSQIACISSIDIKADEQGLVQLARDNNLPYHTYGTERLSTVEHRLSVKSEYVYQTVGVYGVAESAALIAAGDLTGQEAELLLTKVKSNRATCAIARTYQEGSDP